MVYGLIRLIKDQVRDLLLNSSLKHLSFKSGKFPNKKNYDEFSFIIK